MTKHICLLAFSVFSCTLIATADPVIGDRNGLILQDFDNAAEAGKQWKTVNDKVMGGRS